MAEMLSMHNHRRRVRSVRLFISRAQRAPTGPATASVTKIFEIFQKRAFQKSQKHREVP